MKTYKELFTLYDKTPKELLDRIYALHTSLDCDDDATPTFQMSSNDRSAVWDNIETTWNKTGIEKADRNAIMLIYRSIQGVEMINNSYPIDWKTAVNLKASIVHLKEIRDQIIIQDSELAFNTKVRYLVCKAFQERRAA